MIPALKIASLHIYEKIFKNRALEGAASLAFYLTLATFPALITLIAILPYLPIHGVDAFITNLLIQKENADTTSWIWVDIAQEVLTVKRPKLLSFSFIFAIWATSSGMVAIMNQLNVVFEVNETRSIIRQRLIALALTVIYFAIIIFIASTIIIGQRYNNFILNFFGLSTYSNLTFTIFKYICGYLFLIFALSFIYYLGPNTKQKFIFLSYGSLFSVNIVLIASVIFNFYIFNIATYNEIYGSLGGMIVYMLWLYIIGFVLLVGGEINYYFYGKYPS